MRRTGLLLSIT